MGDPIKIANTSEIEQGKTKGFVVNGNKILIANVKGAYYAIGSACTHIEGPLDQGPLEGNVVTCPWHGSQFDVTTGKVLKMPAKTDEPKYELKIVGEEIFVVL